MRCEDIRGKLQEYLDGELVSEESRAVKAHLAACSACREDLRLLRQVNDGLATLPVLEEPVNFTARVMAQISPTSLPAFRLRWEDAAVSFAFAATVIAVLSVFSLLQPQHVLAARAFVREMWWTALPELDRLWHTVQVEPVYVVLGLSTLCMAAAAAASAVVLTRQWMGSWSRAR
jgi:anti-sigma factor (TIGR02949 family)